MHANKFSFLGFDLIYSKYHALGQNQVTLSSLRMLQFQAKENSLTCPGMCSSYPILIAAAEKN